jgi:predicted Zn-dependent protease
MNNTITKFNVSMQAKMKEVEKRLENLKASTAKHADQADKAIRAHVATLEDSAHKAKESLENAQIEMASWVEDTKTTVADWRAKLDTNMLRARADRAERYADASLIVALAGVDEAEKAMHSANLARKEADTVTKV